MTTHNSIMARMAADPPGTYRKIPYAPEQNIAQAVYLSGIAPAPALCSGIALCALCRVRILGFAAEGEEPGMAAPPPPLPEDFQVFSEQELAAGWRLGCRHRPAPGLLVELPATGRAKGFVRKTARMGNSPRQEGNKRAPTSLPGYKSAPAALDRQTNALPLLAGGNGAAALLAVDLGTTSLAWRLDIQEETQEVSPANNLPAHQNVPPGLLQAGSLLAEGSEPNPQMGAGTDVISRLAVAQTPLGKAQLQNLTLDTLKRLVRHVEKDGMAVSCLCLAANPAMTALTLGLETTGLATAPYALPFEGGNWVHLPGLPPLWIPPQLSPFVGGDVSAGYAYIAFSHLSPGFFPEAQTRAALPASGLEYPFLLADLGTNGEFLLALSPEEAVCASVALGPALEGIGLSCGTEAGPGAVTAFELHPLGLEAILFTEYGSQTGSNFPTGTCALCACPACAPPPGQRQTQSRATQDSNSSASGRSRAMTGISGTGYLSLLHILLKAQAMDKDGHFTLDRSPLLRRALARRTSPDASEAAPTRAAGRRIPENSLVLPHGLFLSPADVEEILKVKASFSLGLQLLLDHTGIPSTKLAKVYVAGSLGCHVDKGALESLGFFPPGLQSRIEAVGNSSLAGAAMLLKSHAMREALQNWKQGVRSLDLATHPAFRMQFPAHMRFAF